MAAFNSLINLKSSVLLFSLVLLLSCKDQTMPDMAEKNNVPFFIGTYTDGESEGIYQCSLQEGGRFGSINLVSKTVNPSFLTKTFDNRFLIAVNEIDSLGSGMVSSFQIRNNTLAAVNTSSSGGAHPCHLTCNDEGYVLTANYTGGNVGLLRINQKGELSNLLDLQQHTGSGVTDRQQEPHAHMVQFKPNTNDIVTIDLGTNELWFSKLQTDQQKLRVTGKLKMTEGAGPRHLTFHPNGKWIYVVNELDCTVTHLETDQDGGYKVLKSLTTLPLHYKEENTCADIHITRDGNFVYASNRGHNSIAIFRVKADQGSLVLIGHTSTKGSGPRNFCLSPDESHLIVANQLSNNIVSFKRDTITGKLSHVESMEAPSPVCILF